LKNETRIDKRAHADYADYADFTDKKTGWLTSSSTTMIIGIG